MPELMHGGAEKQFRELIVRIDKEQFEIFVIIEHSYEARNVELETNFIASNPEIHFFHLKGLNFYCCALKRYFSVLKLNFYLCKLVDKIRPDIVLLYSPLSLKTALTCKKRGAKVIFSERNSGKYPNKFYRNNKPFLNALSILVCNSQVAQNHYQENSIDALYIPNGIEVCEKLPVNNSGKYEIVIPARIAPVKNQEVIIRALKLIVRFDVHISFIGKIEDQDYYEYLVHLADELDVSDKIEFKPYTQDMRTVYGTSTLVVLSSLSEGFTNVLLESYMYGRQCLVSDIPMNRVIASPTQLFFPANNPYQLADMITCMLEMSPTKREQEIEENYQYVVKNFSMDNMVQNYENLFRALAT